MFPHTLGLESSVYGLLRLLIGFPESCGEFLGHVVPLLSRALRRFSAIIRYMFLNACRDKIVSSVPRYLNLC